MAQKMMTAPSGPKERHQRVASTNVTRHQRQAQPAPIRHTEEARNIPIEQVSLDSGYQRDLNTDRVQSMVHRWDPRLVGTLVLSARGDRLWVVDGQHRLAALREMGAEVVPAIVLTGLTQREEADLFVRYNRSRAALNEWDLFRAEIMAGHEAAWDIVRTFNRVGLTLSKSAVTPTNVQALGSVKRIHALGGTELLEKVLVTIKGLWAHERHGWGATIMYGLALFLYAFEQHERFDPKRLQKVLEVNTPLIFLRKAQEVSFVMSTGRGGSMVTEAIRTIYNTGLSRGKQLGSIKGRKVQSLREPQS